ncbi:MAG TPA: hypothetical protein DHV55_10570 [Clostridiaceae bacterium]|nr:hypothetical protein [Clostridiaceae bacterium]
MSRRGVDVNKLSIEELYKLFEDEVSFQSGATLAMSGIAASITKNGVMAFSEGAGNYSKEFTNWLNAGKANNKVYQGVINGEPVYTGITKQELSTRLYQHNYKGKGLDYLQETFSGLTRNQARAIEQYFIENGPENALNQINSISPTSAYYNDAMRWATDFIKGLK